MSQSVLYLIYINKWGKGEGESCNGGIGIGIGIGRETGKGPGHPFVAFSCHATRLRRGMGVGIKNYSIITLVMYDDATVTTISVMNTAILYLSRRINQTLTGLDLP